VDHFRDEEMFFFGPSVHMFEPPTFPLPEFFLVENPATFLNEILPFFKLYVDQ
jgi:hypothetical protein